MDKEKLAQLVLRKQHHYANIRPHNSNFTSREPCQGILLAVPRRLLSQTLALDIALVIFILGS